MSEVSQVYFLRAPSVGLIKIGRSIDIERRFTEIRLISPVALELLGHIPGDWSVETEYHRTWADIRQHGEWFLETPELREALDLALLMAAWNRAGSDARSRFVDSIEGAL